MTTTPRGAPEMATAQALPETKFNEAIRRTEAGACHFPVADRVTAPPGSCSDGANYIIIATATGAFAGKEGEIATAVGTNAASGWYYHSLGSLGEGTTAYVQDEDERYLFDGSSWAVDTTGGTGDMSGANNLSDVADPVAAGANIRPVESLIIAVGDETTAITTGTAKVTFRMPYAFTLTDVRASVRTAPTGANLVIDINEGGSTILSTALSIDAGEKTSTTAGTPVAISDASLADDAEITIDFDTVGSTIAGAGVKVALIGNRT